MSYYSKRFGRNIWLTRHAQEAMGKRGLNEETVLDVIETGAMMEKGSGHWWIHKNVESRQDNGICAAVLVDQAVIVKTVMVNWQIQEDV